MPGSADTNFVLLISELLKSSPHISVLRSPELGELQVEDLGEKG